jgi:hypothetical protein
MPPENGIYGKDDNVPHPYPLLKGKRQFLRSHFSLCQTVLIACANDAAKFTAALCNINNN